MRSVVTPSTPRPGSALVLYWGVHAWVLRLDLWKGVVLAIVLPALAAAYLGATVYFVWHDQLLASLMMRQTDMQYAYEDRIAALKSQLVQDADQAASDRNAFETGLRDLREKSDRLETHAATIDGVVARMHPDATEMPTSPSDRADALPADGSISPAEALALKFKRLYDHQNAVLGALARPTIRTVERLHRVLARTGLSLDRWHLGPNMGGPFVPLANGIRSLDETAALIGDATSRQAELVQILSSVPVRRPFAGQLEVTSAFGARLDPFFGRPAMHTGVDLHEDYGESVAATARGIVSLAGTEGGYGKMVEIDHGHGIRTRYAHLDSIAVSLGQTIEAGALVGQVGSTGRATGPHLHYEVRVDGEPVDPMRFLKAGDELSPPG